MGAVSWLQTKHMQLQEEREAPPAAGPTGELYHGAPTIANAQMTLQAESCSSPAQELLCGQSTTSIGITREPSDSPPRQVMEGQQPPGSHFQQRPGMNRLALPEPGTRGAFEQLVATPDQAKPAPPNSRGTDGEVLAAPGHTLLPPHRSQRFLTWQGSTRRSCWTCRRNPPAASYLLASSMCQQSRKATPCTSGLRTTATEPPPALTNPIRGCRAWTWHTSSKVWAAFFCCQRKSLPKQGRTDAHPRSHRLHRC